jgi:hypothetical protein
LELSASLLLLSFASNSVKMQWNQRRQNMGVPRYDT